MALVTYVVSCHYKVVLDDKDAKCESDLEHQAMNEVVKYQIYYSSEIENRIRRDRNLPHVQLIKVSFHPEEEVKND